MSPVRFSGGGESHSLYAEEQGQDVVPMMRSTPTPVETWLNTLRTDAGVRTQLVKSDPQVTDTQVTDKKTAIAPLVTRALGEEAEMDTAGERADDAVDADPATAQDEQAVLEAKARETAAALEEILEALGLTEATDFKDHFRDDIEAMNTDFAATVNGTINSRINADLAKKIAYTDQSWSQIKRTMGNDTAVLTGAWARPLHSGGALRGQEAFMTALYAATAERAQASKDDFNIPDPSVYNTDEEAKSKFLREFLKTAASPAVVAPMVERMLGPGSVGFSVYAGDLSTQIDAALETIWKSAEDDKPDVEFKAKINSGSFRTGGFFETKEFATAQLTYFTQQDATGAGVAGTEAGQHGVSWFLNRVPAGSSAGSARAQKNVSYLADMIRAADPGQHEWILSSQANQAIAATISQLDDAGAEPAEGFANFVRFQHEVRTPTSDLLFSPEYTAETNPKTVGFVSHAHLAALTGRDTALDATELAALYPSGPQPGAAVATIQAHAGGLYTIQLDDDGTTIEQRGSWGSSPRWHETLRGRVSGVLGGQGALDLDDMQDLGQSILDYFDGTIFDADSSTSTLTAAGRGYGQYRFSGGGPTTTDFATIVAEARQRGRDARADLISKINTVIQPKRVS